jgi:hypothetical protein
MPVGSSGLFAMRVPVRIIRIPVGKVIGIDSVQMDDGR